MNDKLISSLPTTVTVKALVQSRYGVPEDGSVLEGRRPREWDRRTPGTDVVSIESGEQIKLASSGGQSPPKAGWRLMLTGGDAESGYAWTLFGLPRSETNHHAPTHQP